MAFISLFISVSSSELILLIAQTDIHLVKQKREKEEAVIR